MRVSVFYKIILLLFSLSLISCSSTKVVTGKLYYSGNEPFIQISIQLSDGTGIKVCGNSTLTDSLEANINKYVTVELTYRNEYDQDCYEVLKIIK